MPSPWNSLAPVFLATARSVLQAERVRLIALAAALPALFSLILVVARLRDRVSGVPPILTDPPEEMHPADLAMLWSAFRKHLSCRTAYRAEILHLAKVGIIRLDAIGTVSDPRDFRITLERHPPSPIDEDFVMFMFMFPNEHGDRRVVTLHELKLAGGGRRRLLRWWADAFERVRGGVEKIWIDQRIELWGAFGLGFFGVPALVATVAPHYHSMVAWTIPAILIGWTCWLLTAWALPARLSRPFRERLARWRSFRRYLKRFSSLSGAPAAGVVVWGDYLADAVALGVAGRVERQLRALDPRGLPPPWEHAPHGSMGLTWFRRFHRVGPTRIPEGAPIARLARRD